jgi:hypothetical protein
MVLWIRFAVAALVTGSDQRNYHQKHFHPRSPFARSALSSEWVEVIAQSARFKILSLATSALAIC